MVINDEAVRQGVVLATILTGFAFAIAAQIVLGEDKSMASDILASGFLLAGLYSLGAVIVAIVYFAYTGNSVAQRNLSGGFFGLLSLAILAFIVPIIG
jgi:hypothetical protein